MKSKYIHMSMLIQGPKQLGNNINLYLGLLQEELDTLWKTPAKTWDASKGEYFNTGAALIMTVQHLIALIKCISVRMSLRACSQH